MRLLVCSLAIFSNTCMCGNSTLQMTMANGRHGQAGRITGTSRSWMSAGLEACDIEETEHRTRVRKERQLQDSICAGDSHIDHLNRSAVEGGADDHRHPTAETRGGTECRRGLRSELAARRPRTRGARRGGGSRAMRRSMRAACVLFGSWRRHLFNKSKLQGVLGR